MAARRAAASLATSRPAPDPGGIVGRASAARGRWEHQVRESTGSTEREDRVSGGRDAPARRGAPPPDDLREPESRWRYTSAIEAARAVGALHPGLRAGAQGEVL